MTNFERIHENIPGGGSREIPYNLSDFPVEGMYLNVPLDVLASNSTVQESLRQGGQIYFIFEDETFAVSLIHIQDKGQFINVNALYQLSPEEQESKEVLIDIDEFQRRFRLSASRITKCFEKQLSTTED